MKYQTKLYLGVVGVSLASVLLALAILSRETEKLVLDLLQSRSLSIAATAASQLSPELISQADRAASKQDPVYVDAQKKLRTFLEANRREDIFISNIFVIFSDLQHPDILRYGVMANPNMSAPGNSYLESDRTLILKNMGQYFTNDTLIENQYGLWLRGYAPIVNQEKKTIGVLAVEINVADEQGHLNQLIGFALWGLAASILLASIIAFFLAKKVTRCLDHLCHVVEDIEIGNLDTKAEVETNDEFGKLSQRINAMIQGLKEHDRLKMNFARYVSKHILEKILLSESPLKLEGERRKVTLLFSDIRQFTQLAEKLPPEEVVHLLNEYFGVMIETIFAQSGTLDKFIGDGIMAEFGAPLDDKKQEEKAIRAAIEMQKALVTLCDKWEAEGKPRIQMGIGIHTGEAVMGNIGSERRTDYTAIGDTVNVAARLEQATKILKTPILLSESTYLGAKGAFSFKDLGFMALPGRKEQIKVYTIEEPLQ